MKIICSRPNLLNAVNTVQKAVSTKSTLPILEGILIKAANDKVVLTGNDLEIGIECSFNADTPVEGAFVINSRLLGEIVRKLPDADVMIAADEEKVVIECGHALFKMSVISSEGFPELQTVEGTTKFEIAALAFKEIIRKTLVAVSNDENRPVLTGMLFEVTEDKLTLVSIDGFRMALRHTEIVSGEEKRNIVVPGKTLSELSKIIEVEDDVLNIEFSDNHIVFLSENKKLVSRLLDGEFPNYLSIIPKDDGTKLIAKKSELLESLERAVTVSTDEKRFPVVLNIENDIMIITLYSEHESFKEEIDVNMQGEKVRIGFNARFLIEALKVIEDDEIAMSFRGSVGPCVITPIEGDKYLYLVVPVIIKNTNN